MITRRLLLVGSDPALDQLLRRRLPDVVVVGAGGEAAALDIIRRSANALPVALLVVAPMAGSGLAAIPAMLAASPETKVVAVVDGVDRAFALRAVAAGAYDVCARPVDPDLLQLVLDRAFRLGALEAENRALAADFPAGTTLRQAREQVDRQLIQAALRRCRGNLSRAARELGISRPTLYQLIRALDLAVGRDAVGQG